MESKTYTVEQLTKIGGKLWEQGTMRRVYFNSIAQRLGLEIDHYNTGNISHAKIHGETISNCSARRLLSAIDGMKIYYDLNKGQFCYKAFEARAAEYAQQIIASIEIELAA